MKKQKVTFTKDEIRTFINEELKALRESSEGAEEAEGKKSHEISAAADTLADAITAFNDAGLPEVPEELKSSLSRAKSILDNMSDNPGQYKGGAGRKRPEVKEGGY